MPISSSLKGNAVVAQSGGCTAVINQSLAGVTETARASHRIPKIFGSVHGIEGVLNRNLIDLGRQSRSLIKKIAKTPSAALGSSRYKLQPGDDLKILSEFKREDIRYLFLIGGNDTANTSMQIARAAEKENYDLCVIHIPKTIDNDLMETDHCPGYGSVARFAAVSTQEAALDTKAMKRVDPVKVIELMGRNAGWIVAAAALLKKTELDAPHLLYVPEVPFEEAHFIRQVDKTLARAGFCIIVISETIRDAEGKRIGSKAGGITRDPFGHPYVEGAAAHLTKLVEVHLKIRARFDKPGTIQRMSMPYISSVDQEEAYEAGAHAVKWALKGMSKVMVGFKRVESYDYKIKYVPIPLEKIPSQERILTPRFFDAPTNMVTPDFVRYALPLIGNDLPEFPTLE